mmetsp:Transcript_17731/g.24913  ORF Transcript_17731/g.24913 Transcript_17731/m.24913 type:complete len:128 (+) Transcript_17731:37-420(+)
MKNALPSNAKMSKEAKAAVQQCVSEFIGFVTNEAVERLQQDKRKTITADDVVEGMVALGFEGYTTLLTTFMEKYRRVNKGEASPELSANSASQVFSPQKRKKSGESNWNNATKKLKHSDPGPADEDE